MQFDRLEMLGAIAFLKPAIPNKSETGKNCVFIRVDDGKFIMTAGSEYLIKKAVLVQAVANEDFTKTKGKLPDKFMIPRADLLGFEEVLKEHKEICKKLSKSDPNTNLIEILDDRLISHDSEMGFNQPRHEFKDLETIFQINKSLVDEIPIISRDISDAMTGFSKSKKIEMTFTGYDEKSPIMFSQGDGSYQAIVMPYKEKEEEGEQLEIGDEE